MKIAGKVAALALAATMTANPVQACWTNAEAEAADVANLNMMMMVSALRCRMGQDNFLDEYNRFVVQNNPLIGAQNAKMKAHFARINGAGAAEGAMDRFVIGIANNYGGGHESMGCTQLKMLAGELAYGNHTAASLQVLARTYVEAIPLPGGECPVAIAVK